MFLILGFLQVCGHFQLWVGQIQMQKISKNSILQQLWSVSVKALIKSAHVDLYDVPFLQDPLFRGNAVNDLIVDADARRSGKAVKAEEGRLCASLLNVVTDHCIQLPRAYPFADVITGDEQSLARDLTRFTHCCDLQAIFDLYHRIRCG